MKWLQEKYEWLFYILYKKFKAVYPKGAHPENYAFVVLNLPFVAIVVFAIRCFFPVLTRNQIAIICVILSIPLVAYFNNERVEKIEHRYRCKEEEE